MSFSIVRFKSLSARRKVLILWIRVQDGGMVLPAELPADFRQRRSGELLREVHGDLAGEGDWSCSAS